MTKLNGKSGFEEKWETIQKEFNLVCIIPTILRNRQMGVVCLGS